MCVAHYQFSSMSHIDFIQLIVCALFVSLCVLSFDLDRFSCCWFFFCWLEFGALMSAHSSNRYTNAGQVL